MPQINVLQVLTWHTVFMVLVDTFKLKHLPNKLTRYYSMNVVTPRIIIVVQVFEQLKVTSCSWKSWQKIHIFIANCPAFSKIDIPGPHVHLSVHVLGWWIMKTLHYLPCVISDSVHKRVELNKRSLDIRDSGNEKHERHDQLAIMDSCIRTMHTMRD